MASYSEKETEKRGQTEVFIHISTSVPRTLSASAVQVRLRGPFWAFVQDEKLMFWVLTREQRNSSTTVDEDRADGRHLSKGVVQLEQLEGGQQLPRSHLPHVHVKEAQVRFLIQLVHGPKLRLCEGPAERLWAPLHTRRQPASARFQTGALTRYVGCKRECGGNHAAVAVDVDDNDGRVLSELLRSSFQQDSVKQQRLTPGWRERLRQHLSS